MRYVVAVLLLCGTASGQQDEPIKPALMRSVISFHLCMAEAHRARIDLRNRATKQYVSKLKARLRKEAFEETVGDYSPEDTEEVDKQIAYAKKRLVDARITRLPCNSPDIKLLAICDPDEGRNSALKVCESPRMLKLEPAAQAWSNEQAAIP